MTHWQGNLQLVFGREAGETQLHFERVQAPLKVQRPFYPEGEAVCHSVMLHTAGGVVGGDRLAIDLTVQPHAHALLTTAAAGKLYRTNGLEAQQTVHIRLANSACLEWVPQETIVFNQALYHQILRVDLAEDALWLGWEINRFGRTAMGETFVAGNWRSHTEVWQGDRPLWIDRQWLPGCDETWHSPHGLAGCPVVGSLAFVGRTVEPAIVQAARSLWTKPITGEMGVSRLQSGLLCRYRGHSTIEARHWFIGVWQLLRSTYLARPLCIPRVWQL
jgi:urease accessory protein